MPWMASRQQPSLARPPIGIHASPEILARDAEQASRKRNDFYQGGGT
jgi:hypothetical protein